MKSTNDMALSASVPYCKISYSKEPQEEDLPMITNPEEAYQFLMEIWDAGTLHYKEEFLVLMLNNSKKCLGWAKISSGGSTATIVEPAMVFQVALLSHSNSIVLAHNHPSGNKRASTADIQLTKRLSEAGKLIGIRVEDHLIITSNGFTSLVTEGLL